MDAEKSISDAKKEVQNLKKVMPEMFPEYIALKRAEKELELSKERLKFAREKWNKLGK